ncbi:hypothetical protein KKE19_02515 [Patescibacteria group bacterium]|nr:hypothetical protein [Patescibacteria group bacterium]MBU4367709.1 hypothetical protein [Patescibacteria group bacterium]MBU4461841.1 hypothetical protein [Patescibacteria group bacterium]MCG2700028.1 hypothetical protein [Candidatus Parcubacteria bacterium]
MKEKLIELIIYLIFIIVFVLGFLFFVYTVIGGFSSTLLEDRVFSVGLGISIGGSLLLGLLLKLGEKIKFLNNFLEKPPIKKTMECLLKIFIFIWVGFFLYWLLGVLVGTRSFG